MPEPIADDALLALNTALSALKARAADYALYDAYYNGRHRMNFASERYRNAFGYLFAALRLNLCPSVVNAPADRLEVTAFGVREGDTAAADAAWAIWQENRMDLRAGMVHTQAFALGDAYCVVWPNAAGAVRIHPNRAETVYAAYDEEEPDKIAWAAKVWRVETMGADGKKEPKILATLYRSDFLYKYESRGRMDSLPETARDFVTREVPGEPWPLPNPFGTVPVFHFANDEIGGPGRSELRDITPLQDGLNKTVCDMMVGMEFEAYAQRWAVGLEVDVDETTGQAKAPFNPAIDRVWSVPSPDVKFGEFSRGDLNNFLAVKDSYKLDIAQVSGTPLHYLSLMRDPPSGEALKTLEARFSKKIRDRQSGFGASWEGLMSLALRMAAGTSGAGAGARLVAQWTPAAPVSDREFWETGMLAQQNGVTKRQVLKESGKYGEEEIETMLTETAQERADVAELAVQRFDRGQ